MMKMKGTKMICASQASTAVCMSVEKRSVVRPGRTTRTLEHAKLLERKGNRDSDTHDDNIYEHHCNRNAEKRRDERHHRPKKRSPTTKNISVVGKPDQDQSTVLTTSSEVVVMRVSLHCKACARKVKKHISKMEGVKALTVELEKQKVTVVGNIPPQEMVERVSLVKHAELWPASHSS